MKVFLSWSGEISNQVAEEVKEWLQSVIQVLEPWFSPDDIEKGARWSPEIAKELGASKAGIVCVTPENQSSPWLNFEAGAISNAAGASRVCTFVIGMKPTDVKGPLSQFQATILDREDARRLVGTLNRILDKDGLSESSLSRAFDAFWPEFEKNIKDIEAELSANRPVPNPRPEREIIEEILAIVREMNSNRPIEASSLFGNSLLFHQPLGASGFGGGVKPSLEYVGRAPADRFRSALSDLLEYAHKAERTDDHTKDEGDHAGSMEKGESAQ